MIAGFRFNALVFPYTPHAPRTNWATAASRSSGSGRHRRAEFRSRWDVRPMDATATAVMDFLAAGLADHTYTRNPTTGARR